VPVSYPCDFRVCSLALSLCFLPLSQFPFFALSLIRSLSYIPFLSVLHSCVHLRAVCRSLRSPPRFLALARSLCTACFLFNGYTVLFIVPWRACVSPILAPSRYIARSLPLAVFRSPSQAQQAEDKQRRREVEVIFRMMDTNSDGYLSVEVRGEKKMCIFFRILAFYCRVSVYARVHMRVFMSMHGVHARFVCTTPPAQHTFRLKVTLMDISEFPRFRCRNHTV